VKLRKAATILVVLVCAAIQVSSALAQGGQTDGPLTKNKLMKMLLLNDSSQQDLIKLITHNGVDFRPTPTEETDLHEAGGSDDSDCYRPRKLSWPGAEQLANESSTERTSGYQRRADSDILSDNERDCFAAKEEGLPREAELWHG
jgi:hypothetical protein